MRVKTSVSLSEEVLRGIDEFAGDAGRSAFIEAIVRRHIRECRRAENFDAEVARLNAIVDGPEPPDVLDYSADPFDFGDDAALLVENLDGAR